MTDESRNNLRETSTTDSFSTTNLTWTDFGLNPGISGDRATTNLRHGTALQTAMNLHYTHRVLLRALQRTQHPSKANNLMLYREIREVPLCCEERINKMCGEKIEFW